MGDAKRKMYPLCHSRNRGHTTHTLAASTCPTCHVPNVPCALVDRAVVSHEPQFVLCLGRHSPVVSRLHHGLFVRPIHADQQVKGFNVVWRQGTRARRDVDSSLGGSGPHTAIGPVTFVIAPATFLVPAWIAPAGAAAIYTELGGFWGTGQRCG